MSEYITHTAVLDDCFRLMMVSSDICNDFHVVGHTHWSIARLGAVTRKGDFHTVRLLESFRERWNDRKPEDRLEQKLAFVLGWLCHRSADRQMKPVFRAMHPPAERTESPTECSIYHEVFILREVYAGGKNSPFNPFLLDPEEHPAVASAALDVESLETLLRTLLQRSLIALHTLKPDEGDIEGWMNNLFSAYQTFSVDLKRYAQAFAHPDTEKVRKYITEGNFYDENDPHIRVARAVQHRDELRVSYIAQALQASSVSHYGQTLKMGYDYLLAASDFFTQKISVEELQDRLNIGKPGSDGQGV